MCEACDRKVLELVFDARSLPDQQGACRVSVALKDAAETIRSVADDNWKQKQDEVRGGSMLRYENRCLTMAAALHAFVHGKRPDGTGIDPQTAINEAKTILGK
jgi:hypothetical protein